MKGERGMGPQEAVLTLKTTPLEAVDASILWTHDGGAPGTGCRLRSLLNSL